MKRIRLAIVDDSAFMRKALQRVLQNEQGLAIVGCASSGEELINNISQWNPDVVTLDLSMPGMGGLLTLEKIMQWRQVPVIILSTHSAKDGPLTIEALHHGAVDFIDKQQYSLMDFDALRKVLIEKIAQVTSSKAFDLQHQQVQTEAATANETPPVPHPDSDRPYDAVVIGASTGGPPVVQKILEDLGASLTVPVAIVQHMPLGFTGPFAKRLKARMPFPVQEAAHAELFRPGSVYIAPAGLHLRLKRGENGDNHSVYTVLTSFPEEVPHRPSVDVLFQSAAEVYGNRTIAVLLTGMGHDGASGMAELARSAAYTIAQNESSCIVYGMPRAAVELGAVRETLNARKIGARISELLNHTGIHSDCRDYGMGIYKKTI